MMAALGKKNITQHVHTLKKKILLCGFVIVHFRALLSRAGTQPLGSPASSTCSLEQLLTFQASVPSPTSSSVQCMHHSHSRGKPLEILQTATGGMILRLCGVQYESISENTNKQYSQVIPVTLK